MRALHRNVRRIHARLAIAHGRGNEQESQNRLRSLRQWMVEKKMDKGMQQRVSTYFNQLWSARSMFDEGEVMAQMPPRGR